MKIFPSNQPRNNATVHDVCQEKIDKGNYSLISVIGFHNLTLKHGIIQVPAKKCVGTINTGWNDKIVVQQKTTLQLYFKTFIEKINSGDLIM